MKEDTKNIASFMFYTVAGVILNRLSNDIYDVVREKIVKKHKENHKSWLLLQVQAWQGKGRT